MYRTAFNDKTFSGLQERSWVHNSVIDNYIQYIRYTEGYNNIAKSQYAIYSFGESLAFQKPDTYRFLSGPIFTKYKKIGLVINEKDLERKATAIQGFVKTKSLKDSRFGDVFVYNNNALHQTLICKEKVINSKEEAFKELQCLSNRMAMNHPSLQNLIDYSCTL